MFIFNIVYKLILNEIISVFDIFLNIKVDSFKINYWIFRNKNNLLPIYNFFIDEREKIYNKYLYLDSKDQFFNITNNEIDWNLKDKNQKAEFESKLNELFTMEFEIEPFLIDLNILMNSDDIRLNMNQIILIKHFLNENNI